MPRIKIEHIDGNERLYLEADIGETIEDYFVFFQSWLKAISFDRAVIEEYVLEWSEEIKFNG